MVGRQAFKEVIRINKKGKGMLVEKISGSRRVFSMREPKRGEILEKW